MLFKYTHMANPHISKSKQNKGSNGWMPTVPSSALIPEASKDADVKWLHRAFGSSFIYLRGLGVSTILDLFKVVLNWPSNSGLQEQMAWSACWETRKVSAEEFIFGCLVPVGVVFLWTKAEKCSQYFFFSPAAKDKTRESRMEEAKSWTVSKWNWMLLLFGFRSDLKFIRGRSLNYSIFWCTR